MDVAARMSVSQRIKRLRDDLNGVAKQQAASLTVGKLRRIRSFNTPAADRSPATAASV